MPLYRELDGAILDGLVRSAATPTKGGVAVSLAKCAMGGMLGGTIDLSDCPGVADLEDDVALFSESNGRFVVTVAADDADAFDDRFSELACQRVGEVSDQDRLTIQRGESTLIDLPIEELRQRFKEGLADA